MQRTSFLPLPFFLVALTSWTIAATATATAKAAEDGFRTLFNGRDLSGWVNVNCGPETWSVRDGVIHCTGFPTGTLRTEQQYENFILELEWRHLKPGGNAGVFVWAGPISAPGVPFLRAVEVQVLDNAYNANGKSERFTTHGDVFPIHGSTMEPFGRHRGMRSFPSEQRSKGSPEWNHYRIECNDGILRLRVNGKEVSGGKNCNWRKGYLALESEGSPVDFRNLRIRELASTGAGPEVTAPLAQGHRSLYTGLDLRGWTVMPRSAKSWQPMDWRLVFQPADDGDIAQTFLWTEEFHEPREWIVDFRVPGEVDWAGPVAGFCTGGDPSPLVLLGSGDARFKLGKAQAAPGEWHRLTVQLDTGRHRILLDGEEVGTVPASSEGAGPIGLLGFRQRVEFANFYLRD